MTDVPPVIFKRAHAEGCPGSVVRQSQTVTIDRIGRIGNGGIVAHDYRCNRKWAGCPAHVLVTERAVRSLAVAALPEAEG